MMRVCACSAKGNIIFKSVEKAATAAASNGICARVQTESRARQPETTQRQLT